MEVEEEAQLSHSGDAAAAAAAAATLAPSDVEQVKLRWRCLTVFVADAADAADADAQHLAQEHLMAPTGKLHLLIGN